ncbi:MAG: hypothetical protein ACO1QB_14830 [Verrucomicrobiales bacterium]
MNRSAFSFRSMLLGATLLAATASAEVITFENGDQLKGSVVSLNATELKFQNANLGLVTIPRDKIASIILKEDSTKQGSRNAGTNRSEGGLNAPPRTNDPIAQMQGGIDPRILEQVQKQFLDGANPEANAMFNETLSGLMSGRINLNDLREQARTTLDELKKVQNELDEEDTALLGLYSGILEGFIAQGTNATSVATNRPPASSRSETPTLKQSPPGKLEFQKPSRKTPDLQE